MKLAATSSALSPSFGKLAPSSLSLFDFHLRLFIFFSISNIVATLVSLQFSFNSAKTLATWLVFFPLCEFEDDDLAENLPVHDKNDRVVFLIEWTYRSLSSFPYFFPIFCGLIYNETTRWAHLDMFSFQTTSHFTRDMNKNLFLYKNCILPWKGYV